jgi:hypothetical protein
MRMIGDIGLSILGALGALSLAAELVLRVDLDRFSRWCVAIVLVFNAATWVANSIVRDWK